MIALSVTSAVGQVVPQPKITFVTPSIVRIQWTPDGVERDNATGSCVYSHNLPVEVARSDRNGLTLLSTSELVVEIDSSKQALTFRDKNTGKLLLAENAANPREFDEVVRTKTRYDDSSAHMEQTANGKVTVKDVIGVDTVGIDGRYRVNFLFNTDEALYGLGSHMEDYMNLLGKTLYLTQHNLKATVPVINSTGGYGLLFDAGCAMKFSSDSLADNHGLVKGTMELEATDALDYYFIKGDRMQDVVEGYRYLTGDVSMMPRYLFGYIQSKERYVSSDDLISTLREYRRREIPIDMIVQDWNYWPEGWGYMKMNRRFYPDPAALADSIHALDARLMVSIWPNPQYCPEERDFRERGFMLEHSVYDAFNPAARDHYWSYVDGEFFSNGFDAWWCDSSEPLDGDWNKLPEPENGVPYGWNSQERRWKLNSDILGESLGTKRSNLYSLYHSKGIYDNQRKVSDEKRVVNLTRSSYSGQQRYGTVVWNGDTHASWESFRQQIPSGLNYVATGNPYWTVDVGCFFTRNDGRWFYCGEFQDGVNDDSYKEFYTRMFQWATFLPVLRSHGTDTPREIWRFGEPGTPYYDAIRDMIDLRYSLIPYTYSLADAQHRSGYTMSRPLAFDFPTDRMVWDIKDQYMFGDIMVCPVTSPGISSRKVYLPQTDGKDGWVDYWTGQRFNGGTWVEAETPLSRLPLFVRSGAIVPSTAPTQFADAQIGQPVTLTIFDGKDCEFVFYEDAGDGYAFERGEYLRIPLRWNNTAKVLEIGKAEGDFADGMSDREFTISLSGTDRTVKYNGESLKVQM